MSLSRCMISSDAMCLCIRDWNRWLGGWVSCGISIDHLAHLTDILTHLQLSYFHTQNSHLIFSLRCLLFHLTRFARLGWDGGQSPHWIFFCSDLLSKAESERRVRLLSGEDLVWRQSRKGQIDTIYQGGKTRDCLLFSLGQMQIFSFPPLHARNTIL